MRKIVTIIFAAILAITLAGCGLTENYAEPSGEPNANDSEDWSYETWTEEFDLSLVERYEFSILQCYEGGFDIIVTISVDDAEEIQRLNDFLGNTVMITHSDMGCYCYYNTRVYMRLTNGETMWFGIERTVNDTLVFNRNEMSWISFTNISYDDFMDLVMSLGSVM